MLLAWFAIPLGASVPEMREFALEMSHRTDPACHYRDAAG